MLPLALGLAWKFSGRSSQKNEELLALGPNGKADAEGLGSTHHLLQPDGELDNITAYVSTGSQECSESASASESPGAHEAVHVTVHE